jgi:hypothetical protein
MKKLNGLLTFLAFLIVGIGFFLMFGSQSHRVVGQGNSCSVTGWAWGGIEEICSLSANPSSILIGESSTIVWHSQNATSGTLNPGNISLNPPSSGSMQVTPLETTFYTATFDSPEGPVNCEVVVIVTADNLSPPRNLTCTPVLEEEIWRIDLDWQSPLEIPAYGFDYYILYRYPAFQVLQCFDSAGNSITCPEFISDGYGLFETSGPPNYLPNQHSDYQGIFEDTTYAYNIAAIAVEQTGPGQFTIIDISEGSNMAFCNTNGAPDPNVVDCSINWSCTADCEDYGFPPSCVPGQPCAGPSGCSCIGGTNGLWIYCPGDPPGQPSEYHCNPVLECGPDQTG